MSRNHSDEIGMIRVCAVPFRGGMCAAPAFALGRRRAGPALRRSAPLLQHWLFGSVAILQMLASRLVEKAGTFGLQKAK